MTAEDPQQTTANTETAEETPALPDYLASPNAVFADEGVQWRYGRAPDYTKTRKVWAEGEFFSCFISILLPWPRGPTRIATIGRTAYDSFPPNEAVWPPSPGINRLVSHELLGLYRILHLQTPV